MDNKEWEEYLSMCPSLNGLDDELIKVVAAVHSKFGISDQAFVEANLRHRGIEREDEIDNLYDSLLRESLRERIVQTANPDTIRLRYIINKRIAEVIEFIDTLCAVEGPKYIMKCAYSEKYSYTQVGGGVVGAGYVILEGLQSLILHACLFPEMPMTMIRHQVTVSIDTINSYAIEE